MRVHLSLTSDEILRIELEGQGPQLWIDLPADTAVQQRVYVTARPQDPASSQASTDLRFWVEDINGRASASSATIFNGKEAQ